MKNGPKTKRSKIKAKSLIREINKASSEAQALSTLKEILKNMPTIPPSLQWNKITPLAAAARKGFKEVLKYLIEEKKADPNEQFPLANKNVTVLETAIINNHIDSAIYLAEKLKSFVIDARNDECLPLSLAIKNNYLELAKTILSRDQNLLYKVTRDKKNTLLHLALLTPFEDIAVYLLQIGVWDILAANDEGYSPYLLALSRVREKVLELMLDLGANPLSCSYWNENYKPLLLILNNIGNPGCDPEVIKKCLNHLLAAGAGLDIFSLPSSPSEKLFTCLNLQDIKQNLGPFLLLAKQKQEGGLWKYMPITQMVEVKQCWHHPDWQFKDKQLALAASYPKLKGDYIKDLQEIFLTDMATSNNDDLKFKELAQKEVKDLTTNQLIQLVMHNWNAFCIQATMFKTALIQTCLQAEDLLKIVQPMKNYFKMLSNLIIFLNHPNVNLVNLRHIELGISSDLFSFLKNEFSFLVKLHISSTQFYSLLFLNLFYEHLGGVLKMHHKILTCSEYLPGYYSLKVAQMTAALYLAQMATKNSVRFYWALKGNQLIDDLRDYRSQVWQEPKLNALFALAMAYVFLGWHKKAYSLLKKAFKLLNFTYHSVYIIGCIEKIVATLDATLLYSEDAIQVLTQCCCILQAYQEAFQKIVEHGSAFDIMLFNTKGTLKKIQQLYFIKSPLLRELKNLGMNLHGFEDSDILLILDQEKIPLENEFIKFSLNSLPSNIQYDHHDKVLRFKSDLLPMRSIAWLRNFKKLLIEIKQSNEKIALIQDFSNLTMEPSKPKVKIKTRPEKIYEVNSESRSESDSESVGENSEEENSEEENYGFNLVPEYSPPVPILCKSKYIPPETLFLSVPTHDPAFLPFLNHIRDKESGTYHGVYSIAKKGLNQPGVKFFVNNENIDVARFKILGANGKSNLRATGTVSQTIKTKKGRERKLFVLDTVENKKTEKRKRKNLL